MKALKVIPQSPRCDLEVYWEYKATVCPLQLLYCGSNSFFSFHAAVCVEVSAVTEVRGHVGGDVTIHCSGNRMAEDSSEHFNLYFCKGVCSSKNTVIQTAGEKTGVTRTGRYSMEADGGIGAFKVNITRLRRADAGRYRCGVGKTVMFYQEINLVVLDEGTVCRWWYSVCGKYSQRFTALFQIVLNQSIL